MLNAAYSLPLDGLLKPMNPVRRPCEHQILAKGHANDDEVPNLCILAHLQRR